MCHSLRRHISLRVIFICIISLNRLLIFIVKSPNQFAANCSEQHHKSQASSYSTFIILKCLHAAAIQFASLKLCCRLNHYEIQRKCLLPPSCLFESMKLDTTTFCLHGVNPSQNTRKILMYHIQYGVAEISNMTSSAADVNQNTG